MLPKIINKVPEPKDRIMVESDMRSITLYNFLTIEEMHLRIQDNKIMMRLPCMDKVKKIIQPNKSRPGKKGVTATTSIAISLDKKSEDLAAELCAVLCLYHGTNEDFIMTEFGAIRDGFLMKIDDNVEEFIDLAEFKKKVKKFMDVHKNDYQTEIDIMSNKIERPVQKVEETKKVEEIKEVKEIKEPKRVEKVEKITKIKTAEVAE